MASEGGAAPPPPPPPAEEKPAETKPKKEKEAEIPSTTDVKPEALPAPPAEVAGPIDAQLTKPSSRDFLYCVGLVLLFAIIFGVGAGIIKMVVLADKGKLFQKNRIEGYPGVVNKD